MKRPPFKWIGVAPNIDNLIPGLAEHPGYHGHFTRAQARGAIPNGARVVKAVHEPGDSHPIGALGTVLGSAAMPHGRLFYFVEWDASSRVATGCQGHKIKPAGVA